MVALDSLEGLDTATRAEVVDLLAAHAGSASHHVPFDGPAWDALAGAGRDRFAAATARDGTGALVGYVQAGRPTAEDRWTAEMIVAAPVAADIGASLLVTLARAVGSRGGGRIDLWATDPSPAHVEAASRSGFEPYRSLLQMKRPLPLVPSMRAGVPELATRPFRPGADEEAFLELNRISFAAHPDQWRLDRAGLERTEREPWFDPNGFLLTESEGRLLGFCWTREFPELDPSEGEIHVIGVHPDAGGRGLGRALVVAGLDHLAERGMEVGMLFVEGDNAPARALYDKLGFEVTRADRAFTRTVASR